MDYSKTVNLPKTNFSMKANLPQREPQFLDFWKKMDLYKKLNEKNKGKEKFILHDGPPYANGHIHLGTALNKILKDIVVKYKLMAGYDSPYIPGWDCHGLPIEYQLMKDLGKNKSTIDRIEFRKKATEYAMKFVGIQRDEFMRLGCFGDWFEPYLTLKNEYEGAIISVFRRLLKDGYVYRKLKPVYWCATCETALADAEVEYADHISPSVFVKFPVIKAPQSLNISDSQSIFVLIWTTTPWTLPANVAVAFQPNIDYVIIEIPNGEKYIFAEARLEYLKNVLKITDYKILSKHKGSAFEGIKCKNPIIEKESIGVLADFVSLEEGTGIVHIAPGHGEEDYSVGLKYNLPIVSPVDDRGRFTNEVEQFSGQNVFAANENIIKYLEDKKLLIARKDINHSYPHCWRCKRPIIFRATKQWFLSVENHNLRQQLLESIKKVKWVPGYGEHRIKGMIEVRPDWCLTRQRYWGTPIPIIYCTDCDEPILDDNVLEKIETIIKKDGSSKYLETPVSEIIQEQSKCEKCGSNNLKKSDDILDVWFDSGVSSFAVLKANNLLTFPADMYLEGSDQHRGWFQTSLIPAVALEKTPPFKTVLTHGFVVDGEGKKMSKSLGNVIVPQDIIKKYGAEVLRLWVASENYQEDIRLSDEILQHLIEAYRKIRNTLRFMLGNISDFSPSDRVDYNELLDIDKWMLTKFQRLITDVRKAYDEYEFHKVFRLVYTFCVLELSSFYFDILKDRLYTFNKKSKERLSAQTVIEEMFIRIVPMLAPVTTFTAEESFQEYVAQNPGRKTQESIFLTNMPVANEKYINEEVEKTFEKIIKIRDFVLKLLEEERKKNVIGNSLEAKVMLYIQDKDLKEFLQKNYQNVLYTFLVSQLEICDKPINGTKDETGSIEVKVLHAEGKKCVRCWMWSNTVGSEPSHEDICLKCVKNL
ncbi:MAG: isoleucine--tRNA ligase [Elusimicrobia bacterium RIFOXYC2_FULL_34_12]|nr:MAG: isoleucine--tRNA ligase [Elusimicrobia bacterium RIFOXYC2_FULL_34_12]